MKAKIPARRFASLEDGANYLGLSPRTLRRMISSGELTGYRIGKRVLRVDLDELETLLRPIPTVTSGGDAA